MSLLRILPSFSLSTIVVLWGAGAIAQSITPAADGTGTTVTPTGNTYTITGGTQAGANLFHSFQQLGLNTNEIADFLSNPSIQNILGRVTGGDPSVIEGILRVSGSDANLLLMNPAGWVFAEGATLDLGGSFTATTATRIGFADGFFQAVGPNDFTVLTGNPASFVFDTETGAIFNAAELAVEEGQSLWLVGSSILSTGPLAAPGGNITIAAVPGANQIRIRQDGMLLELVLDAVPVDADDRIVSQGLRAVDLPNYLTGPVAGVAFNDGDVGIAGAVAADTITFMAAGQVTPSDPALVQDDTTVVRFAAVGEPLALTAVDTTVADYQNFLFGGKAGTIAFTVSPDENGIAAVGEQLDAVGATGASVEAVHIVSEGSAGNFWLGDAFVSHETVAPYREQLQAWGVNLTETADILLYSCLTALGAVGDSLLNQLAAATGADVAASTNLTGNAALGGDWVLEASTGTIEAGLAFEPNVLANYADTLATFTVTDGGDSGAGTLRQAISDANGAGGADEIRFSGLTLVDLTSGELQITDELTITGGATNVTVQRNAGASDFRVFNVTGGVTATFDHLTIANGQTTDSGGGIHSNGAVNLSNSTVSSNSSNDRGGGVYSTGSAINLANSTVSNNSSTDNGGGIYSRNGSIALTDSIVSDNSSNRYGGGVHTRSQIVVTNSTVSGNSSRRNGGGLYSRSGNITLTNSTVSGNSSNRHGGGVWARNRTITLTDSTVFGNSARVSAAGMYSATVNIADSVILGNTSGDLGGGVYFTGNGTIANTTISGNSSANKGGGMYFRNNLTLTNSTLSGNVSNRGGGIYSRGGGTVSLTNMTLSGNSSRDRGGGIFLRGNSGGTTSIFNSTIADNTSSNNGGGIFRNGGTVNLTNTIVATNTAGGSGNDLSGSFNTVENSLISDAAGATITTSTNNLTGVDPGLFALGDYGGDTQTHALRPDSPALNAGSNALTAVAADQRGAGRIFDGTVEIGAYESHGFSLQPLAPSATVDLTAATFDPIDTSMQVVEAAFAQPLPLAGLSINYGVTDGVLGTFSDGTTVITDASGMAVNVFNLTGFDSDFGSSFQIAATPVNPASFTQAVASAQIKVTVSLAAIASFDFVEPWYFPPTALPLTCPAESDEVVKDERQDADVTAGDRVAPEACPAIAPD